MDSPIYWPRLCATLGSSVFLSLNGAAGFNHRLHGWLGYGKLQKENLAFGVICRRLFFMSDTYVAADSLAVLYSFMFNRNIVVRKLLVWPMLGLCVFSSQAWAKLQWATLAQTQIAQPTAAEVSAVYAFTNQGAAPVGIVSIKSSCGCTTAALEKRTYAPGESGEIVASLKIDNRQGVQKNTITVSTDDGEAPVVLTMETTIPRVLTLQPAFVIWHLGGAADPKSISIKIGINDPVRIVSASSDNENVAVEVETLSEGREYRLNLYPLSTDETIKARVTVETDYPAGAPRSYVIHAHVRDLIKPVAAK